MIRSSLLLTALLLTNLNLAWGSPGKKPVDNVSRTEKEAVTPSSLTLVYLSTKRSNPQLRPFFDPEPQNLGAQGSLLGIDDNNTTGRFTGQSFKLKQVTVDDPSQLVVTFKSLLASQNIVFLVDLPPDSLLELSRLPEAREALLLDIANGDDRLRGQDCQTNVFYLMPSDAMRADALAQYFGKKRWTKWFLVKGANQADNQLAEAARHAAKKFGAKIVKEVSWSYTFDDRRTPESEIPVFTQGDDYDLVWVSDTENQFGDLFPYRTWQPRPVTGTSGLTASAWHKAHEMWGALQLQNRFREKFSRPMEEKDYAAWLAIRSIGEAATRSHSVAPNRIREMLLDPSFSLAGFKGVPLSFRAWDHQLRQPILLAGERSIVGYAPIDGYLHPQNTLDTLGYDSPESSCRLLESNGTSHP
jgi:ABC transporter substrate binding protein (PQQ-dependent alcohol dehydrogenase system)